jgi:hypothetical protein
MKPRVKAKLLQDCETFMVLTAYNHPARPTKPEWECWTSRIIERHPDGSIETMNTIYELVK